MKPQVETFIQLLKMEFESEVKTLNSIGESEKNLFNTVFELAIEKTKQKINLIKLTELQETKTT